MKEKIDKTLSKILNGTAKESSPSISRMIKTTIGDPNCPHCAGAGYVRYEVPMDDSRFGRLEPCVCRSADIAEGARTRLFELSRLDRLSHLTFDNFDVRGNRNTKIILSRLH